MVGRPSYSLLPLECCKILHLVRHAEGIHNVEGEKDFSAYLSEEFFDAPLTQKGWDQVDKLRDYVITSGLSKKIDLVITSPLLRTMQTAVGVFGGEPFSDRAKGNTLMVENAGNSNRPAISSLNGLSFIAVEDCRELLGVYPCDRRRRVSEYRTLFPAIDFSLVEINEDTLWKCGVEETDEEIAIRGMNFIDWLWTRKEKEIAIVSHRDFLLHMLKIFAKDLPSIIEDEICKLFENCELRSMIIIADKSLLGFRTDCIILNEELIHGDPDLLKAHKKLQNGSNSHYSQSSFNSDI